MASTNPGIVTSKVSERVSTETIDRAVNALLKWRDSKLQSEKTKLFDPVDEFVYLIFTRKEIPPKGRTRPYQIILPHSLASEFSEHCLIIDDRSNSSPNKEEVKKKIKDECIPVSKVLRLSKLKANYQAYEAKRKFCDSYNMFFADRRVIPLLPRLLGKKFFKSKKIPIALNLEHQNWKEQMEKACRSALYFLSTGTCAVVKVAKPSMGKDEIVENVVAAINGILEIVPKSWKNVRSLHLKLVDSVTLPIYQAFPDYKLKIAGVAESLEAEEGKQVSGDEGKKGEKVRKKKGRIHEVKYMDDITPENELEVVEDVDDVRNGNKDDVDAGAVVVEKKRKKKTKAQDMAVTEMNELKRMKKTSKYKPENGDQKKKEKVSTKEKKGSDDKAEDVDDVKNGDTYDVDVDAVMVDKKRKKRTKAQDTAVSEMNGSKRMKKTRKYKHEDGDQKKEGKVPTTENKSSVGKSKKLLTSEDGDIGKKKTRKTVSVETRVKVKKSKKSA